MKKYILVFTLFAISSNLFAQPKPDVVIKNFFQGYSLNPNKAVEDLFKENPPKSGLDEIGIKAQLNLYVPKFWGEYNGYEEIVNKHIGKSLYFSSSLVKYDLKPMRFTFEFYKSKEKWELLSFTIDDNIDKLIEASPNLIKLIN